MGKVKFLLSLPMDEVYLKGALEALLFSSPFPLDLRKMREILGVERDLIRKTLEALIKEYESPDRGVRIREVAGGFKIFTRIEFASFIRKLKKLRKHRLSLPALETLAIIAYKQPITRQEIEEIRGVESKEILYTLLKRKLIRIVGRKKSLGRPILYGTTKEFLTYFGLKNLEDLPRLEEVGGINGVKEIARRD